MLQVGLANLAQQKAFQARRPLAVVGADLCQQPMRLATPTGTPEAHGGRTVRQVAGSRCRARQQLPRLQDDVSRSEALDLVQRTAGQPTGQGVPNASVAAHSAPPVSSSFLDVSPRGSTSTVAADRRRRADPAGATGKAGWPASSPGSGSL